MVATKKPNIVHLAVFTAECTRCSWEIQEVSDADLVKNAARAHAEAMRHEVEISMAIPKMFYDVVRPSVDGREH